MDFFVDFAILYLAGALAWSLILGIILLSIYSRDEWWHFGRQFASWVLIWPLTVVLSVVPGVRTCFDSLAKEGKLQRTRERLRSNPPPCSATIVFTKLEADSDARPIAEIEFDSQDVARAAEALAQKWYRSNEFPYIAKWAMRASPRVGEKSSVPSEWRVDFERVADALLREGKGQCRCELCDANYDASILKTNDDRGKDGWNFTRIVCPKNHEILALRGIHILRRREATQTVEVHILDPKGNYSTTWEIGKDISAEILQRLGDPESGALYALTSYEGGKPTTQVCKKEIWLKIKAQFDSIEQEGADAMAATRKKYPDLFR